jgi:hypothetical protein
MIMDFRLACQYVTLVHLLLGEKGGSRSIGLGFTPGNLDAAFSADTFSTTKVIDVNFSPFGCICQGCTIRHVYPFFIRQKSDLISLQC